MYQDPIIDKYMDLFKKNGVIKQFYQGDPMRVGMSTLPCMIISKSQTRVAPHTNAEDEHEIGFTLTIITDIRKDLKTNPDPASIAPGLAQLYELIEGRDKDTLALNEKSILNILRTNQLVDSVHNLRTDLSSITRIQYPSSVRQRDPETWTVEATVDFVANFIQLR